MDSYVLGFTATTSNQGADRALVESVVNDSQFHPWQDAPHHQTVSQSEQANKKEQFASEIIKKNAWNLTY